MAELKAQSGYSLGRSGKDSIYAMCKPKRKFKLAKHWIKVGVLVLVQHWVVKISGSERVNTLLQAELPYWEDLHQWNLKINAQVAIPA